MKRGPGTGLSSCEDGGNLIVLLPRGLKTAEFRASFMFQWNASDEGSLFDHDHAVCWNPFNPSTQIEFSVDTGGPAELTVYNLLGQPVAALFRGNAEPGRVYTVQFNGKNLGSGVYLYELRSNTRTATRRMILMK